MGFPVGTAVPRGALCGAKNAALHILNLLHDLTNKKQIGHTGIGHLTE